MNTKSFSRGLLLVCVSLWCGCSINYAPSPAVPRMKEIPDFPAGSKVELINAQPSTTMTKISQAGISVNIYASLHDWTESLNTALMKTLKKKGVDVSVGAPKTLKIAVTKAIISMAGGGWTTRTTIVCNIETGDGQSFQLGGDDTGINVKRGAEGAVEKTVTTILNDERIEKYLSVP